MSLADLRNIGIVAHIDAGKTTVTERILHLTGVEHRVGRVDEGTATMDWMAEERERGITITSAATRVTWGKGSINLIDTPGHVDFTVEVERCMRVLDGAVLVIDAVAGVQAQTETVWRQMRARDLACIAFINKCDKPGADVLAACESMNNRLGAVSLPVAYPIVEEDKLVGVVDCLTLQAWGLDDQGRTQARELPADLVDEVSVLRAEVFDVLAEEDEALMEAVLEGSEPDPQRVQQALRERVIAGTLVPALCGAALRGIGVELLLDGILAWLPSPLDMPPVEGLAAESGGEEDAPPPAPRPADPDGSTTALAFKVQSSDHGDLTFVRVYAGRLRSGGEAWNPRTRYMERIGRIQRMHADHGEPMEEAVAGDIAVLLGLKNTATGDTLCDRADPIQLESVSFPDPVIALIVEPAAAQDRDKLRAALERLAREDPSLHVVEDSDTGQWTLHGMGELHLEVNLHRLQREYGVTPRVGQPRVRYREALIGVGCGAGRVDQTLGGREVFGSVDLEVHPAQEGQTSDAGWDVHWPEGLDLPEHIRRAVEEAVSQKSMGGPRFGFALVAGSVHITAVGRHPEREDVGAYVQAAISALGQALRDAPACLLEPRMSFEVQSPEAFSSGIIADLAARRAVVREVVAEGDLRTITGTVALGQMFGYSTAVRSLSQGRAGFSLTPAGFVAVPEGELEVRGLSWH
jgi:elongation factor G